MRWLVHIDKLMLQSLCDVCMAKEDTKVAVLLGSSVRALPSSDADDTGCFFDGQSWQSAANAWSISTRELHGERHVWIQFGGFELTELYHYGSVENLGKYIIRSERSVPQEHSLGKCFSPQLTRIRFLRLCVRG